LQDILAVARRKFREQDQVIDCQPLNGLRSLEAAAAATGNEVVSMGGPNTNRAVDASWPCRMSRTSWAREATEGCGGSVGGGSGRRYATSLSCACGTAISANDRLTSSVLTFGGCRFVRIEHLHPYLYGRFLGFLGCHDENHIKHLHK